MDGASLARRLLDQTADRSTAFRARTGRSPCLAAVLVGEDPSSITYVAMKQTAVPAGAAFRHVS